jgi:GNAT superfamily N-acetyltransferase
MTDTGGESRLTIRAARREDAPALAPLAGQLGYRSTIAQVERRLARLLDRPEDAVFVAETEGWVIGWVHVGVHVTVESDPAGEIRGLVVDARHRGAGVGRRLMERAEEWARERSLGTMRVRSNVVRGEAHAFYQRLGYTLAKTQHAFGKTLR